MYYYFCYISMKPIVWVLISRNTLVRCFKTSVHHMFPWRKKKIPCIPLLSRAMQYVVNDNQQFKTPNLHITHFKLNLDYV